MAFNGIISSALTGLFTNQAALRVTSNNIANVNTPDYARERVVQSAFVAAGDTFGVQIDGVQRIVNDFLEGALLSARSRAEEFTAQRETHERLQGLIGSPDSGSTLAGRLTQLFDSANNLTLGPADSVRRQAFIADIQNLLDETSRIANDVQELRTSANQEIEERVEETNDLLRQIYELNRQILAQGVVETNTGGLEQQRTAALNQLSELIGITVQFQPDGAAFVSTGGGVALIDARLHQLDYAASGTVTAQTQFPEIRILEIDNSGTANTPGDPFNASLETGRLAGLQQVRDVQLVDIALGLGEFAAQFADQANAIHNQFAAVPPPNSLTGTQTGLTAAAPANFDAGLTTFAVVDANGAVVASTTQNLSALASIGDIATAVTAGLGGAGTLSFTNGVAEFSAGNAAHGVVILDDPADPAERAGRGFSHFFGLNNLITSRQPGVYDTGVVGTDPTGLNAGTIRLRVTDERGSLLADVTINDAATHNGMLAQLNDPVAGLGAFFTFSLDADGALVRTPNPAFARLDLSVVNDTTTIGATGVSYSQLTGIGNRFVAEAASNLRVVDRVAQNPSALSLATLDLASGLSVGDQSGALAFAALQTQSVDFSPAGGLEAATEPLGDYLAEWFGYTGLLADRAERREADNVVLRTEVETRRLDVSGVNMDEELANLVVFQNAYNAAARILTTAQELLDTLLVAVSR